MATLPCFLFYFIFFVLRLLNVSELYLNTNDSSLEITVFRKSGLPIVQHVLRDFRAKLLLLWILTQNGMCQTSAGKKCMLQSSYTFPPEDTSRAIFVFPEEKKSRILFLQPSYVSLLQFVSLCCFLFSGGTPLTENQIDICIERAFTHGREVCRLMEETLLSVYR